MKRFIATITLLIALTGLCFAKPVYKTVHFPGSKEGIELAYTNKTSDVKEIVSLFEKFGKIRDDKRDDFKMAYYSDEESWDYAYCIVNAGKSYTLFIRPLYLEKFEELNPTVYWLEKDDGDACVFLDCDRLPVDEDIVAGTVKEAVEHGHRWLCSKCQERLLFSE